MEPQKLYYFYDKNSYINNFSSPNINDIFHEILSRIDNSLTQLMMLDIKLAMDKMSFDNLICIETLNPNHKPSSFITNTYKLNIKDMVFVSQYNNIKYQVSLISDLTFISTSIIQKMNGLNGNGNKKLAQTNIKQNNVNKSNDQNTKPTKIHDLLGETKSILNNINTTSKENKVEVQPNISRPMNSVLYEDTPDDDINIDPIELKKTLDELKKMKDDELKKLEQLKTQNQKDLEDFSESNNKLGDLKRELKKNMDREQEKRSKFEANKIAYRRMKQDINDGKLSENKISELFAKEYPIYKLLDEKNLLDTTDEYIIYSMIFNELDSDKSMDKEANSEYIPHNYHYLNEDDQNKYKHIYNDHKDMIHEFITKQLKPEKHEDKNVKIYPSLEEILDNIDNDKDINIPDF